MASHCDTEKNGEGEATPTLERQLDAMRTKYAKINTEKLAAEKQIEELKADLAKAKKSDAKLEETMQPRVKEFDTKVDTRTLQERNIVLEQEKQALETQKRMAEAKARSLDGHVKQLEDQAQSLKSEKYALELQIKTLNAQIEEGQSSTEDSLHSLEKSTSDLSLQLAAKDCQIAELQKQFDAAKKDSEEMCSIVGVLTHEKRVAETELADVVKEREKIQYELASVLAAKRSGEARLLKVTQEKEQIAQELENLLAETATRGVGFMHSRTVFDVASLWTVGAVSGVGAAAVVVGCMLALAPRQ